jgi:hypothetical protein
MGITMKYVNSTSAYLSVNTGTGSDRTYNTYCGRTLLSTNRWYHLGFTYDGAVIRLYVNGILDGEYSYSGQKNVADYIGVNIWSFADSSTTQTIYGEYKTIGYLNDFRVYDHCLSAKEVKLLAQGLIAHYKLDGTNFAITDDCSGFKNHLTQIGTISQATNSARYNSCIDFN